MDTIKPKMNRRFLFGWLACILGYSIILLSLVRNDYQKLGAFDLSVVGLIAFYPLFWFGTYIVRAKRTFLDKDKIIQDNIIGKKQMKWSEVQEAFMNKHSLCLYSNDTRILVPLKAYRNSKKVADFIKKKIE